MSDGHKLGTLDGCELGTLDGHELGPLDDRKLGQTDDNSLGVEHGCDDGLELGPVLGWDEGTPGRLGASWCLAGTRAHRDDSAPHWAQMAACHGRELGSVEGWADSVDDGADECLNEGWLDGCRLGQGEAAHNGRELDSAEGWADGVNDGTDEFLNEGRLDSCRFG